MRISMENNTRATIRDFYDNCDPDSPINSIPYSIVFVKGELVYIGSDFYGEDEEDVITSVQGSKTFNSQLIVVESTYFCWASIQCSKITVITIN